MTHRFGRRRQPCRQRGAIAIVFSLMLLILVGFIGMSLDLGLVYNRRAELQTAANVAALAAAAQLNGTAAGISAALSKAASALEPLKYQYQQLPIAWNDGAIAFGTSASGSWVDAASAQSAASGLMFVQVDASQLDPAANTVELYFLRLLSDALAQLAVGAKAVAGRSSINVAPIAVCALSNTAAAARLNPGPPAYAELVEYGFRRGIGYDLMQLNPNGTTAENFVIDPFDPPGVAGTGSNTGASVVGPFVCTGQLAMARVTGAPLTVSRPFPLAALYNQLNSRFDQYAGPVCSATNAPPDTNIKSYAYGSGTSWMSAAPGQQGALRTTAGGPLWTIADPWPAPAGNTSAMYGPLWAFARAVPYSAYVPGAPEPAGGYTPFSTSTWSSLYKPGAPSATGFYPAGTATPYKAISGSYFQAPSASHKGVANRRVLNVALLACPVAAGTPTSATVLGIGRFLMTVPATPTSLYVEFGGLAAEQALAGPVELYP